MTDMIDKLYWIGVEDGANGSVCWPPDAESEEVAEYERGYADGQKAAASGELVWT